MSRKRAVAVLAALSFVFLGSACSKDVCKAVSDGDVSGAERILDRNPELINEYCEGFTPVHDAVLTNNLEMARMLIEKKADLNKMSAMEFSSPPIDDAVKRGLVDMFDLLVENGADVNVKYDKGYTLLHFTYPDDFGDRLQDGQKMTTKLGEKLIEMGLDVNAVSDNGTTPLQHMAMSPNAFPMFELLMQRGAAESVNLKNKKGETALTIASRTNNHKAMALLIENGADVNTQNNKGATPLHMAAAEGNMEAVRILLESGADPSLKNDDGKTPAQIAEEAGKKEIAELIKEAEAAKTEPDEMDVTEPDEMDETEPGETE